MQDRKDVSDLAARILESAQQAKAQRSESVLADDTLGRLLKRAQPVVARYARVYGACGLILLPVKVHQVYLRSGVSVGEFGRWIDVNEPLLLPKFIGAIALLAAMILMFLMGWDSEVRRYRRKRHSKAVEAGSKGGFNSQT